MRRRIFAFWIRVAGCKEKIVQSSSVLTDWISCWVRKVWHHNHATHNSRKKTCSSDILLLFIFQLLNHSFAFAAAFCTFHANMKEKLQLFQSIFIYHFQKHSFFCNRNKKGICKAAKQSDDGHINTKGGKKRPAHKNVKEHA